MSQHQRSWIQAQTIALRGNAPIEQKRDGRFLTQSQRPLRLFPPAFVLFFLGQADNFITTAILNVLLSTNVSKYTEFDK